MTKFMGFAAVLTMAGVLLAGCGETASETRPVTEIRQEAADMTVAGLERMAQRYRAALNAKEVQLTALQDSLKDIPVSQLLGEEARAIKSDIDKISGSIRALTERMNIYLMEIQSRE